MIALRCYDLGHGSGGGICDWIASFPGGVRDEIKAALEVLQTEETVAKAGQLKPLKNGRRACRDLTEIRIEIRSEEGDVIHVRFLGFPTSSHEFVLLVGFRKRTTLLTQQSVLALNSVEKESRRMSDAQSRANSHRVARLAQDMHDERSRHGYVEGHSRHFLARQMRGFRGDRTQAEFGGLIDKRQTVVSRLEDGNYRGWTLGTMFEIARKLGVAVFVRFVDFQTFLKYSDDMSDEAIHPRPYDQALVDATADQMADDSANDLFSLYKTTSMYGLLCCHR